MFKKILLTLAIVVAMMGIAIYLLKPSGIGVKKATIDDSPLQIEQIRKISQWEFLTVECEVLVDTVRARQWPVTPDRLARIYSGAIRIGVNLDDASADWIETEGDSVVNVSLPALAILDDRFIDEASTISFYESGKWDESVKKEMYDRAAMRMRKFALTGGHLDMARTQAVGRFTALFKGLGFDRVNVSFIYESGS